jgi:hypothetical protein
MRWLGLILAHQIAPRSQLHLRLFLSLAVTQKIEAVLHHRGVQGGRIQQMYLLILKAIFFLLPKTYAAAASYDFAVQVKDRAGQDRNQQALERQTLLSWRTDGGVLVDTQDLATMRRVSLATVEAR